MTIAHWVTGDTREVTAQLPDACVDLVLTSPPFLALRSYLPADHADKQSELGSEPTPAAFIDMLLRLTAEWGRVLAPHGSICVELGDTYAGSGGGGGDYLPGGIREGQAQFAGSASASMRESNAAHWRQKNQDRTGWPLDKSLALIPELYRIALAYGGNPFSGEMSPAGRWRVRNVIRWVRPNPPVGALGDKFRPATTDLVVACRGRDRWFDLDAVRTEAVTGDRVMRQTTPTYDPERSKLRPDGNHKDRMQANNPGGAPPLDWWNITPSGYSGTTSTTRQEPCGPHDGGLRTTSRDCPKHAGLPGQLPKALRDERAATAPPRTPRTGDRPAPTPPDGSAPTRPPVEPTTAGRSSDSPDPSHAPAASPRGKGSSRTDPVPATSSPGTASDRSPAHTADTSTSPLSGGPHPDTPGNRTSGEVCPPESDPRTEPDTADTPSEGAACTCSFTRTITESTSHYAVWPPQLCVTPIEAMCPRRVCRACGAPSRRVVAKDNDSEARQALAGHLRERRESTGLTAKDVARHFPSRTGGLTGCVANWEAGSNVPTAEQWPTLKALLGMDDRFDALILSERRWTESTVEYTDLQGRQLAPIERSKDGYRRGGHGPQPGRVDAERKTPDGAGWTTCACPGTDGLRMDGYHTGTGWRPGRVLDPFAGTGTTLAVATGHGRDAIGIDIDSRNVALARERIGMFLTETTGLDLAALLESPAGVAS